MIKRLFAIAAVALLVVGGAGYLFAMANEIAVSDSFLVDLIGRLLALCFAYGVFDLLEEIRDRLPPKEPSPK